jgi:hypothetical protein
MSRFYTPCFECRRRMTKFSEDTDRERIFYSCRNCGRRYTYFPAKNAVSEDWPKKILEEAIRRGIMTEDGRFT